MILKKKTCLQENKKFSIIYIILFYSFSCISYTEFDDKSTSKGKIVELGLNKRIKATANITYFRMGKDGNSLIRNNIDIFRNQLLASNLFSNINLFTETDFKNDANLLSINISIKSGWFSKPFYGITYFLSGFTLFLFPGYEKEEYLMTVNLYYKDKIIKQYEYKYKKTIIFNLFLAGAFWGKNGYNNVTIKIINKMLEDFISDFKNEKLWELVIK